MPKSHAPYPPEFRTEAIRLVRTSGKPMAQIARDLGVTSETLRIWMKQADIDDGLRHDGLTTEEHPEPFMPRSGTTRDENGVVPTGRVPVVLRARPRV